MSRPLAKEEQVTTRAKTQLGWGNDNPEEYKKWRRHVKAYALANGITGRRGTSTAAWQAFRDHTMDPKNGLPASGRALLQSNKGDKDGDKARDRFHYLLLDSLKKDRETETKEGLASAKRKRDQAANDSDGDAPGPIEAPALVVRVAIIQLVDARDLEPKWGFIFGQMPEISNWFPCVG